MQNAVYAELGFVKPETESIIQKLDAININYHIHYQKLRNYHWNVTGGDFFDLHNEFEADYDRAKAMIDRVAERIRTLGGRPTSNMKQFIDQAELSEGKYGIQAEEMVKDILDDYSHLIGLMVSGVEEAHGHGDLSTADLLTKEIKHMEKRHWMFTSFLKK